MQLKTSTKISLKFTIFAMIIVFLFGLFVNIVFLKRWYSPLIKTKLATNISAEPILGFEGMYDNIYISEGWAAGNSEVAFGQTRPTRLMKGDNEFKKIKKLFRDNILIDIDAPEYLQLKDEEIMSNISKIDNQYFYSMDANNIASIIDITSHIEGQKNLIYTSIYLMLIFGILSYFISLYFVQSSLSKLNELVDHVKNLDVDNLNNKLDIKGPEDDEINILAIKMNDALEKIHKQTLALKDFISNASHELKTPLMSMNSEIDYAIKSKKHKNGLENTKTEIKNMNNLLDELVLITKLDSQVKLEKKEKNISDIILKNIKILSKNYENKEIKINKKIDSVDKFIHNSSFDIIAKNLIENALKYTNSGTIDIILTYDEFVVKDTGDGINNKNLDKIWDRFWQEDNSKTDTKSFGLGLYLTKLLVEKHGWEITVDSKKGKGSEFKILF